MSISEGKLAIQRTPYGNFHKNIKKSIIMNKIQIDSGYPQEIFAKVIQHQNQDYLVQNKKNLKNFFSDRLPHEINSSSLKVRPNALDPSRIFEIKRQQHELKNQTKIYLNNSYIQKKSISFNKKIQKITQFFCVHDKTLELKEKFGKTQKRNTEYYDKDNHRRGTCSFVQKRTKITKKQAYDKVFGPDISSVSRTLPTTPMNTSLNFYQKNKSAALTRRMNDRQSIGKKRQQLSKLIRKIDDYKNKMKPVKLDYNDNQNQQSLLTQPMQNQAKPNNLNQIQNREQLGSQNKVKVLQMIKNIANGYKGQSINQNRLKIANFADLQKLDSKFYSQLNNHKKNRLQKRMYQLYRHSGQTINVQQQKMNSIQSARQPHMKTSSRQQTDALSVTQGRQIDEPLLPVLKKRMTVIEKFQFLGKNLVKAVLHSDIYMIKHQYAYQAFWQTKQPFQMEGSYAFFKAIKKNDLQCVKTFVEIDNQYLYETDLAGKTPLIYASLYNRTDIAKYFLEKGSNVDKNCLANKNALYYALQNNNFEIVKSLLQYGANPWSTEHYSIKKLLNHLKNEKLNIVFGNAKKIFLGVRLQLGNKNRAQFWHQNKHKINQFQAIVF